MSTTESFLTIALCLQLAVTGTVIFDILTKSQRSNKLWWIMMTLFAPVAGVILYHKTMQRKKGMRILIFG